MTFVPPKVNQNVWATYVEDRRPQFKVHSSEAKANSAVGTHYPQRTVVKYNLVDGEWAVNETFETPDNCAYCGADLWTYPNPQYPNYKRYTGDRPWTVDGPMYNRPIICYICTRKDRNEYNAGWKRKAEIAELDRLKAKYDN